ncbi:MAG TPA: PH domain-containing protein [Candidatus Krumholzibacteria bacterium]|nr:PH domain-containing protein [Candidatus Krumholzibacteria bacterium]
MKHYAAPWSTLLTGTTAFATLVCLGVAIAVAVAARNDPDAAKFAPLLALLPMVVVIVAVLFMVRGYVVTADEILVRRLLWSTRFERARLQSAARDPESMRGSIRLFGNGGLFSFTGLFRSPKLGRYRAYVTDPARAVVLRFADRVVVVSPHDPDAFVRDTSPRR